MAVTGETLYIKGSASVEVTDPTVTLGNLVQMECARPEILPRLKTIRILKFPEPGSAGTTAGKAAGNRSWHEERFTSGHGRGRTVVSALKLIECIHQVYPGLAVENLGAQDIIVTLENQKTPGRLWHGIKAGAVVLISFAGSAFSIMAFNNDVDTTRLFGQIYEQLTGRPPAGMTILETTYSIGITVGILVFFNHFGKKRFSVDPTPMEVEMRKYETDIQTTLVEIYDRKEKEIDVDAAADLRGRRP